MNSELTPRQIQDARDKRRAEMEAVEVQEWTPVYIPDVVVPSEMGSGNPRWELNGRGS